MGFLYLILYIKIFEFLYSKNGTLRRFEDEYQDSSR